MRSSSALRSGRCASPSRVKHVERGRRRVIALQLGGRFDGLRRIEADEPRQFRGGHVALVARLDEQHPLPRLLRLGRRHFVGRDQAGVEALTRVADVDAGALQRLLEDGHGGACGDDGPERPRDLQAQIGARGPISAVTADASARAARSSASVRPPV